MGFHWNGTRRYQVRRVDLRCLRERFEDLLFRWVRRWVRRWERRRAENTLVGLVEVGLVHHA